jgi:transposase
MSLAHAFKDRRRIMAGQSLEFWSRLLHLPGFVVVHSQEELQPPRYCFTVVAEQRIGVCPHCHQASAEVHQTRTRERIVDLPISGYAVELKVRACQFLCACCAVAFTPDVPFLAERAHATERFLARAAQLIRSSAVANVAKFFGLPEQTLARWYYDYVERRRAASTEPLKPIGRIGIDELSLKKNIGSSSP